MLRKNLAGLFLFGALLAPDFGGVQALGLPMPREGDYVAHNFRFHTGEILLEVKLHYLTLGEPTGEPVLVLHGTSGAGINNLSPDFGGELFGPGQPLDAQKYYIILPDGLGTGQSSKPSDGLRARFPHYNYDDMVLAQYRLVTEGLGLRHLRLIVGNSMGGMHTWLWGETWPDFADALVPMASLPGPMSGRNWITRRLLVDTIRSDPAYRNGDYVEQPAMMRLAANWFGVTTSGGTQGWTKRAPTREAADAIVDDMLAGAMKADANDYIWQWEASRDYNPAPALERIKAAMLIINSADDERNPPELGVVERALPRLRNARYHLIPGGPDTRGHGTSGMARLWKDKLIDLLRDAPHGAP